MALIGCSDHDSSTETSGESIVDATPVQRAITAEMTPLAVDDEGMPRLMAANANAGGTGSAAEHVARLATSWGVSPSEIPTLTPVGEVEVLGGTITRLRQEIDGVPVDSGELRVMRRPDGTLVAASGLLRSTAAPRVGESWTLGETGAIAKALRGKYGVDIDPTQLRAIRATKDGSVFEGRSGYVDVSQARARKVWFPMSRAPGATLVAAWVVEAYASAVPAKTTNSDAFRMVVANDGRVLAERNLTADAAFSYRVFAETTGEKHPFDGPLIDMSPHPTGHPDGSLSAYTTSALVSVDGLNHPSGGTADSWLASGSTETNGNNVDAYTDFNAPDGLSSGDFRASTTGANAFDRAYDLAAGPMSSPPQQMAGITSLFYTINWLHDFWYDGGFTEAAGNGQASNYGRGGIEGDAIKAEAQDNALGGSRNNANMSTPDDGMSPRMQVFLWGGKETRTLTLGTRAASSGSASFGPTAFDLTAPVMLADDGMGTGSDACTALPAATGKIVLVDRGTCSFKTKVLNAQTAGAAGVILANNAASTNPPTLADDSTITTPITIPALSILQTEGTQLKADIAAGATSATMHREVGVELEGTLDATVVSHEFGHYVHHRLSNCGSPACGAMSEGWGDFSALLVESRAGDNLMGAYPIGIYSTQGYSPDAGYYAIRRAPYSADHAINDLSFRHMTAGVAAIGFPFQILGNNSEAHNAGEVWASMLWEGYVALQQAGSSFDDVRLKMRKYVVAGLLMSPPDATPTETRDAILTAARAASPADYDTLVQAYARRGFGSCAVSAPRQSSDFQGIAESKVVKGNAVLGATTLAVANQCDTDQIVDAGESAHITLPIANTGALALTNVVATLTSTTTGVTVTSQPVMIGTLAPYANTLAAFDVSVADSIKEPTAADLKLTVTTDDGCATMIEQPINLTVNTDDAASKSATDSFDAIDSVWTTPATDSAWTHARPSALDGTWFGADGGSRSDSSLTSPALTADATAPVTITFSHSYSFEYSQNEYFDGGVIEITTDNGTTWTDIASMVATSPYNGTLGTMSNNPLGGRAAFGRTNPSYPNPDTVTLDLGTQLAGKTFQIRFRVATDEAAGAPGWTIDDVAFTGITGTPFPTLVADDGVCGAGPGGGPDGGTDETPEMKDGSGCCQSSRGAPVGSTLFALSVLGLVLRRRR